MSEQLESENSDRSATLRRVWDLCLHLLSSKVSKPTLEGYIRPTQPISYIGDEVTLGVISPFAREWLEKKALNAIRSALEFHLDTTGLQVKFVLLTREQQRTAEVAATRRSESRLAAREANLQPTLPLDAAEDESPPPAEIVPAPAAEPPPREKRGASGSSRSASRKAEIPRKMEPAALPSLPLSERYQFENFLVGRSNRLAHASAMSVAARPGTVYNPLFLYGGPGLGKTHLLQGIAHGLKISSPQLRVAYVSGEYFAQHYITAVKEHATEDFRRQYREVDVWIVDDIQFIAGKEHTKEEFFHTFNTLYQSGRQVVLASDRSPRELNTMDERLRSRFQSGLIADIGPPELETRIAFLQKCREREGAQVSDDVLTYIADAIQSNMRALEGALTRLIAYSSVMNAPMSAELAQNVLSEYFIDKPIRIRKLSVDDIAEAVAVKFGTTAEVLKGSSRNKDISLARQVAIYLCREHLPETNMRIIGGVFGGRDHTTIVYACQKLKSILDIDPELQDIVAEISRALLH